ncbi:MAG: aminomethyl transferase family protein [Candidatus Omnitrophica bacterium]|nr:aminomethyl transferase family protein [Candidatus Omnitrophota bacterium]
MVIPLLLHGQHPEPVAYQPFAGWMVPWLFRSAQDEYQSIRTGIGLLDYTCCALIECRGADRVSFLHSLLTNDIKRLGPSTACQAALLTPSAKLVAELLVVADPEALWLLCDLQRAAPIVQTLEHHLFSERVTLTNHERRFGVLAVQGPGTFEWLNRLANRTVSLPTPGDHQMVTVEDFRIRLIRHSLTGEPGLLCVVDDDAVRALWRWLQARGEGVGLRPVGWQAFATARIEAGLPWFGVDMDDTNLLPETGLETALVSDTKGCYVGQEIIARMQTYGSPSKKLMGLLLEPGEIPEAGDRIVRNGEEAGKITSACRSPALQRPIAMGYVARAAYAPGTPVEIVRGERRLRATVATRPVVPPRAA